MSDYRRETATYFQSLSDVFFKAKLGFKTEVPTKLLELGRCAVDADNGFNMLGAESGKLFCTLETKLCEKGWPVNDNLNGHELEFSRGLRDFYNGLASTTGTGELRLPASDYYNLASRLWHRDVYDFVTSEDNIKILENAIDEAIGEFRKTYGDLRP